MQNTASQKQTIINISSQLSRDIGTREEYTVPIPCFKDDEITILPGQEISFESYRIQDGLSLISKPDTIRVLAQCVVTLKEFELEYPIAQIEKQCYLNIPDGVEPEDVAQINKKFYQIDTEDIIREAIFLELPMIIKSPEANNFTSDYVHSAGTITQATPNRQNPFAGLRDILDNSQ